MLVVSSPRCITKNDEDVAIYGGVWPRNARAIWRVRTVEATRQSSGFHEADMLIHCSERSGKLVLLGEVSEEDEEIYVSNEPVELWQSPKELRNQLHNNTALLDEVLQEM